MKTIILTSNAYHPSIGGVENSLRHLAIEAMKKGYKVKIVTSDLGTTNTRKKTYETLIDGVKVICYPTAYFDLKILKPINFIKSSFTLFFILKKLKKNHPYANVIARHHLSALASYYSGFSETSYLVPSVIKNQVDVDYTTSLRSSLFKGLHHYLQKKALKKCTSFVFSESMKDQCIELNSKAYNIVKPGVDCSRFHPITLKEKEIIRKELKLPLNEKIVVFVGRFVSAKGVELILESMTYASKKFTLILVGEGQEHDNYMRRIEKNNLNKYVRIFGKTKQVEKFYQCADLFVMSSSYEPLGQTIIEALASGLPIAAFKKNESVNTATQELEIDEFTTYASDFSPRSLNTAIEKALTTRVNPFLISKSTCKAFNWNKLLNQLIDK